MPISIKNEETERLVRNLAELTGESLTEAIRGALAEKYERLRHIRSVSALEDQLNAIALRCSKRLVVSDLTDDEILGYDEFGVPSN